ncbi:tegument-protein [Harp seal herpesvirus]|uniref:Tegument-protein n=1 Tax=phocid gammaherpesvirus 3 TaxID=2560643 RepID=A0A0R5YUC1_9GAMA|nr:tegument-protein [Harp seal herpesvirus]AJG43002.1 tegument-protein [Harp seal herpesvirus]
MERPRGPRFLTGNIPIRFPAHRNHVYFSDSEFTPTEGHFVYFYTQRAGDLTIRRGKAQVENLLFVVCKPQETREDRRVFRRELQALQNIISPAFNHTPFFDESQIDIRGPKALIFTYGPHLYNRRSTLSVELSVCLRGLGFQFIERVEVGRHLVCKLMQDVDGDHIDTCEELFLSRCDLFHYQLNIDTAFQTLPTADFEKVEDLQNLYICDPICNTVMLPISETVSSLSVQTALANSYALRNYCVVTSPCRCTVFSHTSLPTLPQHKISHGHLHAEAHAIGHQPQSGHIFHKSLFLAGIEQAATVGLYTAAPRLNRQENLSDLLQLHKLFHSYARGFNACGIPILGGFYKPINSRDNEKTTTPLVCSSLLCAIPKDYVYSTRYSYGQYIVALGEFTPTGTFGEQPFTYAESSALLNPTWNVQYILKFLLRNNFISSSSRGVGHCCVQDNLFGLLQQGGAKIYASGLPKQLVQQFRERPHLLNENYESIVRKNYLQVYSSQVFITVNNITVTIGKTTASVIQFLARYATYTGGAVKVLGKTCAEEGLHFFNDIHGPGDSDDPAFLYRDDPVSSCDFVVHNWKKYRPQPENTHLPQRLVTEIFEHLDWDMDTTENIICQLLRHPAVGSKEFFVRHADRCCNGLVAQQPGVGPFDLPLADYSLVMDSGVYPLRCQVDKSSETLSSWAGDTLTDLTPDEAAGRMNNPDTWFVDRERSNVIKRGWAGHVTAIGEQCYKFLNNPVAASQYAIAEVLTNIMFCTPLSIENIQLSVAVHWDKNCNYTHELEHVLYSTKEFCADLGLSVVVTSACSSSPLPDSTHETADTRTPKLLTFVGKSRVNGGARVTPQLQGSGSTLVHVAVSSESTIAGSVFEHHMLDNRAPLTPLHPESVRNLFYLVQSLITSGVVLSGHDVSDGGLVACLIEMALASHRGILVDLNGNVHPLKLLLSETPGAVLEIPSNRVNQVQRECERYNCAFRNLGWVGEYGADRAIIIQHTNGMVFYKTVAEALSEWQSFSDDQFVRLAGSLNENEMYRRMYGNNELKLEGLHAPCLYSHMKLYRCPRDPPQVAVLCLPGCPQPSALLAAFSNVGFGVSVLYLSNLKSVGSLKHFVGLAIGGSSGLSHGYLGCRAIVKTVMANQSAVTTLKTFFARKNTFSLCCGELGFELLSAMGLVGTAISLSNVLRPRVDEPTTSAHALQDPTVATSQVVRGVELEENVSRLYECLWLNFHIPRNCKSLMLSPLVGLTLPGWVSGTHLGVRYLQDALEYILRNNKLVCLEFHSNVAEEVAHALNYPRNPTANSTVAGLCDTSGRHLALLCDPSLMFHPWQWQYTPDNFVNFKTSPWALIFQHMFLRCLHERNVYQ